MRPQLEFVLGLGVARNACGNNASKLSNDSSEVVSLCERPEYVWYAFSTPAKRLLKTDLWVVESIELEVEIASDKISWIGVEAAIDGFEPKIEAVDGIWVVVVVAVLMVVDAWVVVVVAI